MNRSRLITLAQFLLTVKPEHFDLDDWRQTSADLYHPDSGITPESLACDHGIEDVDDVLFVSDDVLKSHVCGSTGCAVGWACVIPEFKLQGLHWSYGSPVYTPRANGRSDMDWGAVQAFFDLTAREANFLFHPDNYTEEENNPTAVSTRIMDFMTGAQVPPEDATTFLSA